MRYRIFCGEAVDNRGSLPKTADTLMFDSADSETKKLLESARLSMGINKAGVLTVVLLRGHFMYNRISLLRTVVEVLDGDTPIWRGRALKISDDKNGRRQIEFEGNLNGLLDVPDTMTNKPDMAKHYKIGTETSAVSLAFSQIGDSDTYEHTLAPGEMEGLTVSEYGSTFFIVWGASSGGGTYQAILQHYYAYVINPDTQAAELQEFGYLGDPTIADESYQKPADDPGANAPFFIDNGKIYTKSTDANHDIKIYRRDAMTVQAMFNAMFTDDRAYNGYSSRENYLMRGACDIDGSEIYDPEIGTSCMDTLRHWAEKYGGYIYTSYNPLNDGSWCINYTQSIGSNRDNVPVAFGMNIIDIAVTADGSGVVTAVCPIGIDDEDEHKINLAAVPLPFDPSIGFPVEQGTGYVLCDYLDMIANHGKHRQIRQYSIRHNSSNQLLDLYNCAVRDMLAEQQFKAISVTALDARLLQNDAGRPNVGDRISIQAEPWGINAERLTLNEMEIDFVNPGNGTMRLGNEQKTLTQMI